MALKVYKPEILRQVGQIERIKREFKAGSVLSHPNLVRIYDYSIEEKEARPFLVMEYVDGITLDKWLNMFCPISGRLLLRIVDQLIDALVHLHENGVTHRDFKPQNIMISSSFDIKVMDFGVVRITRDTPITPKDKFVGTIRNSSPEMLFGKDYDHRTDLYSLGTVIYNLLYGEQIFAEENQFATLIDLIKNQMPHFDKSVVSRNEVSAFLLDLTKSLLQKEPNNRPSTGTELKHSLDPIRDVAPVSESLEFLHGYIATPLTGLEEDAREAIVFASSTIAQVAKEYELYVYQPRKATDPILHRDIGASAVYLLDRKRVVSADVLFILANKPSFGVGQELEIAASYGKPTILIARQETAISRMMTGSFANLLDQIAYDGSPEDLARKLRKSLSNNLDAIRTWKRASPSDSLEKIGQKLIKLRRQSGYEKPEELADDLGISSRIIIAIENGSYENIGLDLLTRICGLLGYSVRNLFEPSVKPAGNVKADGNIRRLERVAMTLHWSASDYIMLRDDYLRQLAASGEPPTITEDQWRSRHGALEQRRFIEAQIEKPDSSNKSDLSDHPRLF